MIITQGAGSSAALSISMPTAKSTRLRATGRYFWIWICVCVAIFFYLFYSLFIYVCIDGKGRGWGVQLSCKLRAMGTKAFQYEVDALQQEAFGQLYRRDGDVLETKGLLTTATGEVYMQLIQRTATLAAAYRILDGA
jgi:hypothetical protein